VLDLFRQGDAMPGSDKKGKAQFDPVPAHGGEDGPRCVAARCDIDKDRQAGKAAELGAGFQMGWREVHHRRVGCVPSARERRRISSSP
jgi:hypothetical protein